MTVNGDFSTINLGKADFGSIYVQPDPRAYFRTLGALDYVIPHLARPIFDQLIDSRQRAKGGEPITILDLGCSYGVNAALMRYALSYDQLAERYAALAAQPLDPDEVLALDRQYFAAWPKRRDVRIIGLDVSREAISYAMGCGILDKGIVADLEQDDVPPAAAEILSKVDLIVSTGCVGYISSKTFEKLAICTSKDDAPWVASFVLRMFDYADIARTLERQGLVTEKFEGATFVQRRFRDEAEMQATLTAVTERGLDPFGKESEGLFHAELFFSRPESEALASPINQMVSIASGINRNYGARPMMAPKAIKAGRARRPVAAAAS